jgi:7-cyano-7-deazaguanine synthase
MSENYKRAAGGDRGEAADASADSSAVLFSGGLDSAVLLAAVAEAARKRGQERVLALYVSVGFAWEAEERRVAAALLATAPFAGVGDLVTLSFDMRDVFPATHWAMRGTPPAYDTPDEDVFIDGRNVILLAKAAVYMAAAVRPRPSALTLFVGPLAGNPFPDATPEFFTGTSRSLSLGLAIPIAIDAPFATLHKSDVIRRGVELGVPLELTLSCMNPRDGVHCGACSKCRERIDAFREAGVTDPARYQGTPRG